MGPQAPRRARFLRSEGITFGLLLIFCAVVSEAIFQVSDPAAEVPEYCTIFHHQVKSAGTTIKDKLETSSLEVGMPKPGLCVTGEGFENSCVESVNASYPVIVGYAELAREMLEDSGRTCDFFVVMRHPIDRLVSAFFYCPEGDRQHRPTIWCGQVVPDPEVAAGTMEHRLLQFAQRWWGNKALHQFLFGQFCPHGAFCAGPRLPPPESLTRTRSFELLGQVETILSTYTAVGILEHWDLSMQLFNARVKSPVRDWQATPDHLAHLGVHQANAGAVSDTRYQVYKWARTSSEIHATLAPDLLLYEFAVSLFREQTADSLGTQW